MSDLIEYPDGSVNDPTLADDHVLTGIAASAIRERDTARAALEEIQTLTRAFVDANKHQPSKGNPSKAFLRIAHVEKIAREALDSGRGE